MLNRTTQAPQHHPNFNENSDGPQDILQQLVLTVAKKGVTRESTGQSTVYLHVQGQGGCTFEYVTGSQTTESTSWLCHSAGLPIYAYFSTALQVSLMWPQNIFPVLSATVIP